MSQSAKMRKALLSYVVPNLEAAGFSGEFPNYRRHCDDRIDILCFNTCKYGNAFYVDISTVFPDRPKQEQNIDYHFFSGDFDNVVTGECRKIYRLKGKFDKQFFYTDVYYSWAYYIGVSDKKAETYKKRLFDIRVQKAGPDIYKKVCDRVNKQMKKAYKWWQKMGKK